MTSKQYEEIKEKFSGTWKVDRNEFFEEFLAEVGELDKLDENVCVHVSSLLS